MKSNMGMADKAIRIVAAVVLAGLYFTGNITGGWSAAVLAVAVFFVLTSFISFCPLYALVGLNTKPKKTRLR